MKTLLVLMVLMMVSAWAKTGHFKHGDNLSVHYGVFPSATDSTVADVIYLHGYGDRFQGHLNLFKKWNKQGMRVLSFDFPSHGKTFGGTWDDLDWYSFPALGRIAVQLEALTKEDPDRPLILAGWSTGGLLVLRMVQSNLFAKFSRKVTGLVLFTPGVSVKKCVGNKLCQITNPTLTHDTLLHTRPIKPKSPLYRVKFATNLLYHAHMSWKERLPKELSVQVFIAGKNDKYVKTNRVLQWVNEFRKTGTKIEAFQCKGAYHELDNELPLYGRDFVRQSSASFLSMLIGRKRKMVSTEGTTCLEI